MRWQPDATLLGVLARCGFVFFWNVRRLSRAPDLTRADSFEEMVQRPAQVLQEVPAISHRRGLWHAFADTSSVSTRALTRHHLYSGLTSKAESACEAGTCFTSDGKADQFQCCIRPQSLTSVMRYDGRHSFAEDAPCAEAILTSEASGMKF